MAMLQLRKPVIAKVVVLLAAVVVAAGEIGSEKGAGQPLHAASQASAEAKHGHQNNHAPRPSVSALHRSKSSKDWGLVIAVLFGIAVGVSLVVYAAFTAPPDSMVANALASKGGRSSTRLVAMGLFGLALLVCGYGLESEGLLTQKASLTAKAAAAYSDLKTRSMNGRRSSHREGTPAQSPTITNAPTAFPSTEPTTKHASIENAHFPTTAGSALVCVVVTAYNVAGYLPECLDSITSQTYPHLDIIVVDDASTDNTTEVVAQRAARDSRIRHLRLPVGTNGGAGQPTNRGIEQCKAESRYLALVDGDDYIGPKMYASMVDMAKRRVLDVVVCNFQLVFDEGAPCS